MSDLRQAQDERVFVAAGPRNLGRELWLSECRVQLLVEAINRGITPEERAESVLHADAVNRRLRAGAGPAKVAQPNYAALGLGSAAEAEGRN